MTRFFRKVSRKLFVLATLGAVLVFLMGCCTSFLHPARFWWIAVLGVGLPVITLVLVLLVFFWWFFKSKWAFVPLMALLIGWSQVNTFFSFHFLSTFTEQKDSANLRIMQWNVSRLDQMSRKPSNNDNRGHILAFIHEMNPDIVCMEEFLESNNPGLMRQNIPYFTDTLHYPYYYFARDHARWDRLYEHGVVIFSRYPLLDTLRIRYAGDDSLNPGESLIHIDVSVNGRRIRVFATHLQSLRFDGGDYGVLSKLAKGEDSAVKRSVGIVKKFRRAYGSRSKQAELVSRELDASPYPAVICGDFNDVPNSFTYFKVKGNRSDAFLKKGFGIGRTFASLSPTLRIDYILCSPELEVAQFKKTKLPYSDHYPLVADFKLPAP